MIVVPEVELDLVSCPGWHRELIGAVERDGCRVLVVDLSRVVFFGAAGLSVLVDLRARAVRHGVELRVVVCSRPVWRPLRAMGMVGHFAIYGSRGDALTEPPSAGAAGR